MKDRVPLYPGRVKLTPVSGKENTYDMVRADEPTQEGTPLSKATFLNDTTAALYGLGTDAVPDDVFGKVLGLGSFYLWDKTKVEALHDEYYETSGTTIGDHSEFYLFYSSSYHIENDMFVLENPSGGGWLDEYTDYKTLLNGKYFVAIYNTTAYSPTNILYQAVDATIFDRGYNSSIGRYTLTAYSLNVFSNPRIEEFSYGYVLTQTNTAPVEEGYTFVSKGQLGEKSRIATGSYTGTGACGPSDPTTLSFDFAPKLVLIKQKDDNTLPTILFAGDSVAKSIGYVFGGGDLTVTTSGNSISWYHTGNTWTADSSSGGPPYAVYQLNSINAVYFYAAFG